MTSILFIIFIALLIILGGDRGVISIITLIGNIFIIMISLVLISFGINSILVVLVSCIFVGFITILYQNGRSPKTYSAFFSTLIIILFMTTIIYIISNGALGGGFNEIQKFSEELEGYSLNINVNMRNLVHSIIIIALSGALMDMAVTISSAINEVYINNPKSNTRDLFFSGIKMGREILSSTVNTLFFAYIGEGLLLFVMYKNILYSFTDIINSKSFFQEVSCMMFSCIGCIFIVPCVSFLTSLMLTRPEILKKLKIKKLNFFHKYPTKNI